MFINYSTYKIYSYKTLFIGFVILQGLDGRTVMHPPAERKNRVRLPIEACFKKIYKVMIIKKLTPKRKPQIKKGAVVDASKKKNISKEVISNNYKVLMEKVNKKYSQGLSKEQKLELKEMFLKDPLITFGEVDTILSFLASRGKGKKA
jgi:hypothetical protein